MAQKQNTDPQYRQKETVRNAADEYTSILESMDISVGKYMLDEDLTVLWADGQFYRHLGLSRGESPAVKSLREIYQDDLSEFCRVKNVFREAFEKEEKKVSFICRFPARDGKEIFYRIDGALSGGTAEEPPLVCAVHTVMDETAFRREEERINRECRAEYFVWMMEQYVGNIYISDMDTYELLYLNKTSCETLKKPKKQLLGKKCYEVIQGRHSPCPFCTNHCLSKDEFYEWEFFNPVLDRTFMIKNRIINWNGHRARIEMSHDMYSAEYKLAKKDQEREAIVKTIPGGLVRVDARDQQTILWYSGEFLQMIGYTAEQFEEELDSKCGYMHPDDLGMVQQVMDTLEESGQNTVVEGRILTRSGAVRILTITLCYISGEDSWDGIPSYYSVGIDITEGRMELERQHKALEDAYRAASVANSAKSNFLSSMSHDIRTPMNAIVGMSAIARANLDVPEKVNDCLNKINISSRHLLSLINEVLDMSKIESGKIDLMPEEINLPDLIQNVSDMCRPLIHERHQDFQVIVGAVLHEKVIADGDRLQQVFTNILSNAVKYTPEGGKIRFIIKEKESIIPGKGRFEFIFEDNGIGMSADFIPRIFEPFSRAEDSRISKTQGTGLGMAITENIVHMMNGAIEIKSALGKGSRFTVSVPLQLQAEEEKKEEELSGLTVLVVDDDQTVCENAALLLNELGMRGSWVLSGAEAVRCISEAHDNHQDFFAVILDWKMPDMDGLDTVKAIRNKLRDDVPIIIISAYDYSDIEEEFIRAGADAFITKPLFKSRMLHVLQLFCDSSRLEHTDVYVKERHPELEGKRVLLAEDNELNREIAKELLEMQGMIVDEAENGEQAVELFRNSEPGSYAAVLMDIQMPVLDGYDATSRIRAMDRTDAKTIPVLALTANAFLSDINQAQKSGMNDHVAKPIDIDHLLRILKKWAV